MICQLHQLLADLIPGGAKKALSAARARALLARIRPRDAAGQARRQVAAELIADLQRIYQRKKAADKELAAAVKATGTTLMSLDGIGPSGAARLLVEVGDIAYLATRRRQGASRSVVDAPTGPSSECAPYRRLCLYQQPRPRTMRPRAERPILMSASASEGVRSRVPALSFWRGGGRTGTMCCPFAGLTGIHGFGWRGPRKVPHRRSEHDQAPVPVGLDAGLSAITEFAAEP